MMKRFCSILATVLLVMSFTATAVISGEMHYRRFSDPEIQALAAVRAVIQTRLGEIHLRFFPEAAPNHVDNFIFLARDGFFDGTIFHRVVPGFVIQGGDPNSRSLDRATHGSGGPGYRVKAEFSTLLHKRGTLSMARSSHPDSAGSQFFICLADVSFLDGKYTVFGEVINGMDVVDKIAALPRDSRDNPRDRVEMQVKINSGS
jgi:peptidyl-prolyl cis-trans isomerase B (cyclophilin B)